MHVLEHIPLRDLTTLKVGGNARFFVSISHEEEIGEAVLFADKNDLSLFVLGGGSNIVIPDEGFSGLVLKNEIKGFKIIKDDQLSTIITVGAGESWDETVRKTTERGLWGIENLSLIPGTVGAAPVQNIGAYGVEVMDVIESVRTYDIESHTFKEFANNECSFSYRNSLFKEKKKFIIVSVTFLLNKVAKPNVEYKDIRERIQLLDLPEDTLTPEKVRTLVSDIRKQKLPDWTIVPTAGSFFKNPELPIEVFSRLRESYPELPGYPTDSGVIKIPLAWIIEHVCHLKGTKVRTARIYEKHALVIVASENAEARDVQELAETVAQNVFEKTGIVIENEVQFIKSS